MQLHPPRRRIDIAPLSITRLSGMEAAENLPALVMHWFAQFRPLKAMAAGKSPRRRYA